jgi:hypothetical protein
MRLAATLLVASTMLPVALSTPSRALASTGFIENRGQVHEAVKYYSPGCRVGVYFTPEAVVLDLREAQRGREFKGCREPQSQKDADPVSKRGCAVWLEFGNANPSPIIEARGELPGRYNYFLGNNPDGWRTDVPAYSEIVYHGLWPGVSLAYRMDKGRLVYRIFGTSEADPSQVHITCHGADRIHELENGDYRIDTSAGSLVETCPHGFDEEGGFSWDSGIQDSDEGTTAKDNPASLLWSTFLGGAGTEMPMHGICVDNWGSVYVIGHTNSSDFPTTPGAYEQVHSGIDDVFVAKLNPSGSDLVYATFLGGSSEEHGRDIVVDSQGNVILIICVHSTDFPTTAGAYDTSHNGQVDVGVVKLNAAGNDLVYSTFVGGARWEIPFSVDLDSSGYAYIAGQTQTTAFPTTPGAYDNIYGGSSEAFVIKLNPTGSDLVYSTFLGGASSETAYSIAVDSWGDVYVTGMTSSSDFPTTPGAFDETLGQSGDVFVTKVNATGSDVVYSTFLGAGGEDVGQGIAADHDGCAYVCGVTYSNNFPSTPGAFQESHHDPAYAEGFVTKLNPMATDLEFSTFVGATYNDELLDIRINGVGQSFVAGWSGSWDFPTTASAFDQSYNGYPDVIVARLNAAGSDLEYSTFLGADQREFALAIDIDTAGSAYVCGATGSSSFPTTPGAYDDTYNGGEWDTIVAKLDVGAPTTVDVGTPAPRRVDLQQNTPNPFNPETTIAFQIPVGGHASLVIYNIHGQEVRTLVNNTLHQGSHILNWDGTDENGHAVASGVYFYQLCWNGKRVARRMVLLQ